MDDRDVITPRDAAAGSTDYVPDERLPQLAATWLAEGWSSEELLALASMSRAEARTEARLLLPQVLRSLRVNQPYDRPQEAAARYASLIAWAVRAMEGAFVPYSAAQKVLEVVDDEPETFAGHTPGAEDLWERLRRADQAGHGEAAQQEIREVILKIATELGVFQVNPARLQPDGS